MKIYVDPNQFKIIKIPVLPMGEVNGTVYLQKMNSVKGIGRILVNIFDKEGRLVKKLLTEQDGYFTFLGLAPGTYYARLDERQLQKINMNTKSDAKSFEINPDRNGDIIDGIDFMIVSTKEEKPEVMETIPGISPADQPVAATPPDTTLAAAAVKEELTETPVSANPEAKEEKPLADTLTALADTSARLQFDRSRGNYFIQFGAFKIKENAEKFIRSVDPVEICPYGIVYEYRFYNIRAGYFLKRKEAQECLQLLTSKGYRCFIGKVR